MEKSIKQLIEQRISANHFDASRPLADAEIAELVRLATLAPSAFNFQNWHFVAVRSAEGKARLKALAYGQQKVVDAAVAIIVCGRLAPQDGLPSALAPAVERGMLDQQIVDGWVTMAKAMYEGNPTLQRDEAIRSACLAAMTLMLAAEGMGLVTGPMIGFDAAAVALAFDLEPNMIPAMLLTVGYVSAGNWPQKPRRPVGDVLRFA